MTHAQFVAGLHSGRLQARINPKAAASFVSSRMLLPWFLLPLFGAFSGSVTGWMWGSEQEAVVDGHVD